MYIGQSIVTFAIAVGYFFNFPTIVLYAAYAQLIVFLFHYIISPMVENQMKDALRAKILEKFSPIDGMINIISISISMAIMYSAGPNWIFNFCLGGFITIIIRLFFWMVDKAHAKRLNKENKK